mgnify:CR=1 FL=1
MEENKEEIVYHAPDKLLAGFAKGRIVTWMAAAIGIHILFVGMTSGGYIRDRWIDPDGAAARKKAAEAAQKEKEPPKPAAAANVAAPAPAAGAGTSEQAMMAARTNTPVVQRITQTAKSNEIPVQPGDMGISIEDTNIH